MRCGRRPGRRSGRPRSRSSSARWWPTPSRAWTSSGKHVLSFLVILPIALPGVVTGMALNATFTQVLEEMDEDSRCGRSSSPTRRSASWMVFNNVVARLRRTPASLEDAAQDLGATPLAGVPRHHVPADAPGPDRGRAARVRALLRRGDRDDVHGGRHADAPDLDPQQPLAATEQAADRQRRRLPRRGSSRSCPSTSRTA